MIRSRTIGTALATAVLAAGTLVVGAGSASAHYVEPEPAFHLKNAYGGKCVAVQGFESGTKPFGWDCLDFADQNWIFDETDAPTPGVYRLKNANSGKCLVVQGSDNGAVPFQYDCWGFADQYWQKVLTPDPDRFKLKNLNSGKCLAMQGTEAGRIPFQYDCEDYLDQEWYIR
ncbi:RICIN domain-containing protein [Streptomyces sp. NPDC004327]|uniref:RICIN domain-containing protein n=1 Tax=unclassified Streptomyces TaxID=2593676 RepID=UPI0036C50B4F